MTTRNGDEELIRSAFNEVKRDDARAGSTYAGVLAHTYQRARLHKSPVLRLAAAAVLIAAMGTTYRMIMREPKLTVPSEVVALTAWRPETDALLASPTKLFRAQTQVRESMINLDTLTKGVLQ
jgi:hypothetical protein